MKNKDTTRNTNKGIGMMMSKGTNTMMNMGIVRNTGTMKRSKGTMMKSRGTMMSRCMGKGKIDSMVKCIASNMGRGSRSSHAISSKGSCMLVLNSLARHSMKPFCYGVVEIKLTQLRFLLYVSHVSISTIFIISFTYLHLSILLESQRGHLSHHPSFFTFPCDLMPISNLNLSSFFIVLVTILPILPHFFSCFPEYVEHIQPEIGNQDQLIFS